MSRRRVTLVEDGRIVVGRGWGVRDLLTEAGVRPIYSATAGGWIFDTKRLVDVVAHLEYRNIAVSVIDAGTDEPSGGDAA